MDSTPLSSVSYRGTSASGPQPSVTTGADQNINTGDVTRVSNKDHTGGDVAMEGDSADENSAGRPNRQDQTSEGASRRRESHMKSEMSNRAPL